MSARTRDQRPVSRGSKEPPSAANRRAVVGSSGRPEKGFVLDSGAKQIAEVLGRKDRPSGPHGQDTMRGGGGVRFNVSDMVDRSIGRLDEGSALDEQFGKEAEPSDVKRPGTVAEGGKYGGRKGEG